MLAGTVIATLANPVRTLLLVLTTAKFLSYAVWMVNHDLYLYVIVDYGSAMLGLLLLQVYSYYRRHDQRAKWLISGVLVSYIGAVVQQSGISLHEQFNHNDLYHVIQLAGLCLFYIGARRLEDMGNS
jgi:peptidoglycan/LPS O-acetylase OafA/YrhL